MSRRQEDTLPSELIACDDFVKAVEQANPPSREILIMKCLEYIRTNKNEYYFSSLCYLYKFDYTFFQSNDIVRAMVNSVVYSPSTASVRAGTKKPKLYMQILLVKIIRKLVMTDCISLAPEQSVGMLGFFVKMFLYDRTEESIEFTRALLLKLFSFSATKFSSMYEHIFQPEFVERYPTRVVDLIKMIRTLESRVPNITSSIFHYLIMNSLEDILVSNEDDVCVKFLEYIFEVKLDPQKDIRIVEHLVQIKAKDGKFFPYFAQMLQQHESFCLAGIRRLIFLEHHECSQTQSNRPITPGQPMHNLFQHAFQMNSMNTQKIIEIVKKSRNQESLLANVCQDLCAGVPVQISIVLISTLLKMIFNLSLSVLKNPVSQSPIQSFQFRKFCRMLLRNRTEYTSTTQVNRNIYFFTLVRIFSVSTIVWAHIIENMYLKTQKDLSMQIELVKRLEILDCQNEVLTFVVSNLSGHVKLVDMIGVILFLYPTTRNDVDNELRISFDNWFKSYTLLNEAIVMKLENQLVNEKISKEMFVKFFEELLLKSGRLYRKWNGSTETTFFPQNREVALISVLGRLSETQQGSKIHVKSLYYRVSLCLVLFLSVCSSTIEKGMDVWAEKIHVGVRLVLEALLIDQCNEKFFEDKVIFEPEGVPSQESREGIRAFCLGMWEARPPDKREDFFSPSNEKYWYDYFVDIYPSTRRIPHFPKEFQEKVMRWNEELGLGKMLRSCQKPNYLKNYIERKRNEMISFQGSEVTFQKLIGWFEPLLRKEPDLQINGLGGDIILQLCFYSSTFSRERSQSMIGSILSRLFVTDPDFRIFHDFINHLFQKFLVDPIFQFKKYDGCWRLIFNSILGVSQVRNVRIMNPKKKKKRKKSDIMKDEDEDDDDEEEEVEGEEDDEDDIIMTDSQVSKTRKKYVHEMLILLQGRNRLTCLEKMFHIVDHIPSLMDLIELTVGSQKGVTEMILLLSKYHSKMFSDGQRCQVFESLIQLYMNQMQVNPNESSHLYANMKIVQIRLRSPSSQTNVLKIPDRVFLLLIRYLVKFDRSGSEDGRRSSDPSSSSSKSPLKQVIYQIIEDNMDIIKSRFRFLFYEFIDLSNSYLISKFQILSQFRSLDEVKMSLRRYFCKFTNLRLDVQKELFQECIEKNRSESSSSSFRDQLDQFVRSELSGIEKKILYHYLQRFGFVDHDFISIMKENNNQQFLKSSTLPKKMVDEDSDPYSKPISSSLLQKYKSFKQRKRMKIDDDEHSNRKSGKSKKMIRGVQRLDDLLSSNPSLQSYFMDSETSFKESMVQNLFFKTSWNETNQYYLFTLFYHRTHERLKFWRFYHLLLKKYVLFSFSSSSTTSISHNNNNNEEDQEEISMSKRRRRKRRKLNRFALSFIQMFMMDHFLDQGPEDDGGGNSLSMIWEFPSIFVRQTCELGDGISVVIQCLQDFLIHLIHFEKDYINLKSSRKEQNQQQKQQPNSHHIMYWEWGRDFLVKQIKKSSIQPQFEQLFVIEKRETKEKSSLIPMLMKDSPKLMQHLFFHFPNQLKRMRGRNFVKNVNFIKNLHDDDNTRSSSPSSEWNHIQKYQHSCFDPFLLHTLKILSQFLAEDRSFGRKKSQQEDYLKTFAATKMYNGASHHQVNPHQNEEGRSEKRSFFFFLLKEKCLQHKKIMVYFIQLIIKNILSRSMSLRLLDEPYHGAYDEILLRIGECLDLLRCLSDVIYRYKYFFTSLLEDSFLGIFRSTFNHDERVQKLLNKFVALIGQVFRSIKMDEEREEQKERRESQQQTPHHQEMEEEEDEEEEGKYSLRQFYKKWADERLKDWCIRAKKVYPQTKGLKKLFQVLEWEGEVWVGLGGQASEWDNGWDGQGMGKLIVGQGGESQQQQNVTHDQVHRRREEDEDEEDEVDMELEEGRYENLDFVRSFKYHPVKRHMNNERVYQILQKIIHSKTRLLEHLRFILSLQETKDNKHIRDFSFLLVRNILERNHDNPNLYKRIIPNYLTLLRHEDSNIASDALNYAFHFAPFMNEYLKDLLITLFSSNHPQALGQLKKILNYLYC